MRFAKWAIFFAVSFICSWILITTFSQEVFRTSVPAQVITYKTPPIPLYGYVLGAFFIGLLLGVFMAVYNYVTLSNKSRKKSKRIKALEKEVLGLKEGESYLKSELERKQKDLDRTGADLAKKNAELEKTKTRFEQPSQSATPPNTFSSPVEQERLGENGSSKDKPYGESDDDQTP